MSYYTILARAICLFSGSQWMTFNDALSGYITLLTELELLCSLPQEEYLHGISEAYNRMSSNDRKEQGRFSVILKEGNAQELKPCYRDKIE